MISEEGRRIVERLRGGQDVRDDRFVNLIYGSGAWQGDNPVSRALRAEAGTIHGPFATDNGYIVVRITAATRRTTPRWTRCVIRSRLIGEKTSRKNIERICRRAAQAPRC